MTSFVAAGRVFPVKTGILILLQLAIGWSLQALDYERDIMPIFEEKCSDCHSKDSGKVKGGLRLDDPDHLLGRLSKNNLVIPGDWDASYLFITLYRPAGHDDAMQPEGKGERLTPEEVELVQRWITEGAPIKGERGARGEMPENLKDKPGEDAESMTAKPSGPRVWTNLEGKEITATLLRVDGEVALLRMANGTVYRYPIANLSEESRKALEE